MFSGTWQQLTDNFQKSQHCSYNFKAEKESLTYQAHIFDMLFMWDQPCIVSLYHLRILSPFGIIIHFSLINPELAITSYKVISRIIWEQASDFCLYQESCIHSNKIRKERTLVWNMCKYVIDWCCRESRNGAVLLTTAAMLKMEKVEGNLWTWRVEEKEEHLASFPFVKCVVYCPGTT